MMKRLVLTMLGMLLTLSSALGSDLPDGIVGYWKATYVWVGEEWGIQSYTTFIAQITRDGTCRMEIFKKDKGSSGNILERWHEITHSQVVPYGNGYIIGATEWSGYQGTQRPKANVYLYPQEEGLARMYYDHYALEQIKKYCSRFSSPPTAASSPMNPVPPTTDYL